MSGGGGGGGVGGRQSAQGRLRARGALSNSAGCLGSCRADTLRSQYLMSS